MQYVSNFVLFQGERIWYWIYGEMQSGVSPLLIVHGGPGSPHNYLLPLAELAKERPIIFYDQLGCGKSSYLGKSTSRWNLDYFLRELIELVRQLNLTDFHLLGHSWGSILATEYALTNQSNLKSLILASPCLSLPMWIKDTQELLNTLPKEIVETLEQYKGKSDSEEFQTLAMEYYERYVCRLAKWPQAMMDSIDGANDLVYKTIWGESEFLVTGNIRDYDVTKRLSEIAIPILFTCGRYDEATPQTTLFYKSLLPKSEIKIFEDSSHLPHFEETGKYLPVLSNFMRLNSQ
ncbi:MAG: proline iminopeptidase-family hydrolase [Acidobacteria bacterium]|nr:proline iminopeptidase-family hydrolase [Acidobacteriota bacterium]